MIIELWAGPFDGVRLDVPDGAAGVSPTFEGCELIYLPSDGRAEDGNALFVLAGEIVPELDE